MKFRYDDEKRKFEAAWEKTAQLYSELGMSQSDIDSMREFDWDVFKAERIWALHIQEMPTTDNADEESGIAESPMVKRYFDRFITEYDTYGSHSRHWWVQEITHEPVAKLLSAKSKLEIELLTLSIYEGYTYEDISDMLDIPLSTVGWKIIRLLREIQSAYAGYHY